MPGNIIIWQRGLLGLCLIGFLELAQSIWGFYALSGDIFGSVLYAPVPVAAFLDRVTPPIPGSLAQQSGLRGGDVLDLRKMSADERYWERNGWLKGRQVRLPILRNGRSTVFTLVPTQYVDTRFWKTVQWSLNWAFWLGSAVSLFVAALLAWRRPESPEVRTLSLTLILIVIGEGLFPVNGWITPWPALDAILNGIGQFSFVAGVALLATYATLFARPLSRLRRVLTNLTYLVAGVSACIWTAGAQGSHGPAGLLGIAAFWFGTLDVHFWLLSHPAALFGAVAAPAILALVCAGLAVWDARGSERPRVAWAAGSLAVLYLFGIANVQSYVSNDIIIYYAVLNASWLVAPLGLTYALLSRRLLDIGFFLNRAAVFTFVSLIVVGLFTLAEWALSGWLHSANRITNVVVSAALALALGLSLDQIHKRVDRLVDQVFFRKRHENERTLRRLAREVTFMTDDRAVLLRATRTIEECTDASSVVFALHDGEDRYGDVDENDPAVVTMRASHEVVALHTIRSGLKGEFAYPMLARGQLVGCLVIGPKKNGESYAPDESQAITAVANGVGVALDLLQARSSHAVNPLLDAINALPDAIVRRLREDGRG